MTISEFVHKVIQGFIGVCRNVGISDEDIKDSLSKANNKIRTMNLDDKARIDIICDTVDKETNELGQNGGK